MWPPGWPMPQVWMFCNDPNSRTTSVADATYPPLMPITFIQCMQTTPTIATITTSCQLMASNGDQGNISKCMFLHNPQLHLPIASTLMPQLPMVTPTTSIPPSSVVCPANFQRSIQGHGELGGASGIDASMQLDSQVVSSRYRQAEQRAQCHVTDKVMKRLRIKVATYQGKHVTLVVYCGPKGKLVGGGRNSWLTTLLGYALKLNPAINDI